MKRALWLSMFLVVGCGPNVATIDLHPNKKTLTSKGETFVIKPEPKTDKGELNHEAVFRLKWSSENPAVADVAQNGLVTAHETGTTNIVVRIGKVEAMVPVVVALPDKLELASTELVIVGLGETATVAHTLTDKMGRPVPDRKPIWLSSDTQVVTVQNGVLTSVAPGKTEVTAKLNKLSATVKVEVKFPKIAKLTVSPDTIDFSADPEAVRLQVFGEDAAGKAIRGLSASFASGNEDVAEVTEEGLVRGVNKGKTTIQVHVGDRSLTVPVKVP